MPEKAGGRPLKAIPCFPVWVDDLEAFLHRTAEPTLATGARVRLWARAYRARGVLPADEQLLAKWAGLTPKQWGKVRTYLLESWQSLPKGRGYLVRRVREAVIANEARSAANREKAAARWRKEKDDQPVRRDAAALPEQSRSKARAMPPNLSSPPLSYPEGGEPPGPFTTALGGSQDGQS